MEGQEKYLGGVHEFLLTRGWRGGYAIIATTKRIIGVKPFRGNISDEELMQKSLKSRDFEISREEIKLYVDDSRVFYRVGELLQAFHPKALELEN